MLRASPCPGQLDPADLAEDRREVLEGPLLADLPGIVDAVYVDGVPFHRAPCSGDAQQGAGVPRLDDLAKGHEVVAGDDVLDLGVDISQRVDEADEDWDDGVDASERAGRQGVERGIRSEVLAG